MLVRTDVRADMFCWTTLTKRNPHGFEKAAGAGGGSTETHLQSRS